MSQLSQSQKSAWADHIQSQRQSGLTQQAYCNQYTLKPHQFWYWKSKLENGGNKRQKKQPLVAQSGFVPVTTTVVASSHGLSITLPNGIALDGIDSSNYLVAQQLVCALK